MRSGGSALVMYWSTLKCSPQFARGLASDCGTLNPGSNAKERFSGCHIPPTTENSRLAFVGKLSHPVKFPVISRFPPAHQLCRHWQSQNSRAADRFQIAWATAVQLTKRKIICARCVVQSGCFCQLCKLRASPFCSNIQVPCLNFTAST